MTQVLKIEDLLGTTYNRLTILRETEKHIEPSGKAQRVMVCECSCGTIKNVSLKELRKGTTKSCGCLNKSKIVDIEKENVYNDWTILSEVESYISKEGKMRKVLAKCICGIEKELLLSSLRTGSSKSCGCQGLPKKVKIEKEFEPIPISTEEEQWKEAYEFDGYYISTKGRIFSTLGGRGYLNTFNKIALELNSNNERRRFNISNVVYKTFISDFNREDYIILQIDEDRFNAELSNLFLARITKTRSDWVTRALNTMQASAREKSGQRSKEITLRRKDIIEQYIKQDGLSTFLKLPMDLTGVDNLLGISVDRIDNDKDYEPGNITLVTRFENMGRRSATFDECMSFCAPLVCGR